MFDRYMRILVDHDPFSLADWLWLAVSPGATADRRL